MASRETRYGFEYGAALVQRIHTFDDGSVVIGIATNREMLEVKITPTGFIREIRAKDNGSFYKAWKEECEDDKIFRIEEVKERLE